MRHIRNSSALPLDRGRTTRLLERRMIVPASPGFKFTANQPYPMGDHFKERYLGMEEPPVPEHEIRFSVALTNKPELVIDELGGDAGVKTWLWTLTHVVSSHAVMAELKYRWLWFRIADREQKMCSAGALWDGRSFLLVAYPLRHTQIFRSGGLVVSRTPASQLTLMV